MCHGIVLSSEKEWGPLNEYHITLLSEKASFKYSHSHGYLYNILNNIAIEMSSSQASRMVERQHNASFHLRPPKQPDMHAHTCTEACIPTIVHSPKFCGLTDILFMEMIALCT